MGKVLALLRETSSAAVSSCNSSSSAYSSSCHTTLTLLDNLHTFHCENYFFLEKSASALEFPVIHWSCGFYRIFFTNLLLVRSHQADIIMIERLIQGSNNVTWVWMESRSCNQGRRKNDACAFAAALLTLVQEKVLCCRTVNVNSKLSRFKFQPYQSSNLCTELILQTKNWRQ